MNKRNIIIISIISTIIVIGIIIFFIIKGYEKKEIRSENDNNYIDVKVINEIAVETSNKDEIRVSPNAKIRIKETFEKCGHTIEEEYNVPENIVNMTKKEILDYYKDWNLESFSEELIKISRNNKGKCNEHYVAKDIGGYIEIYSLDSNNNESLLKKTEILTKYLSDEDKEKLKNGIYIIGEDELNRFFEDFD